ncbi:MAG: ATP-binding protein [Ferruginibacter sp.]
MMNATDINLWDGFNQEYLSGMVKLLKEKLENYSNLLADKNETLPPYDPTFKIEELNRLAENMERPPAIEKLVKVFGLSAFERDILLLCAGVELDTALGELVAQVQGDKSFFQPSFGLALSAFEGAHWSALSTGSALRYWRLIEVNKTQLITRSPIKIDEHILHYLAGIRELNEKLNDVAELVISEEQPMPSQCILAEHIIETISQKSSDRLLPVVQLMGNDRADKISLAAYIGSQLQSQLYVVSSYAIPVNTHDNAELSRLWSREALLNNYVLYLDCSELENNDKARIQSLMSFIENTQGLILLDGDNWTPKIKRNKLVLTTAKPTREEQLSLWKYVVGDKMDAEKAGLGNVVSQFNLSADIIRQAGFEVFSNIDADEKDEQKKNAAVNKNMWKVCCRYTRPQVDNLAQRIEPVSTWDDIVLPESQKNVLKEISLQLRQRNKVYKDWGFATKGSRGLGITALFAGESGTGKTMASEVLANELQLDLYKIDLSQVVNKYIGETEKNLKKIFDAAEDGGAILLFDEADALFGKRSDVKDSHDRYSNIEVSYLLQRMEAYRGLAILTTNMQNALDKAFLRRLRFVIHFPFPDAIQRAEIWNRVFPINTPRSELDLEKLSKLTIPGGSIRNIALNAAFFAADEDKAVQMSHIYRAAKSEYHKIEKPFNMQEIKTR